MKLLEKVEAVARQRRLADDTIEAYRGWIQQFLRFSAAARGQWTRPEGLGTADVEPFSMTLGPDGDSRTLRRTRRSMRCQADARRIAAPVAGNLPIVEAGVRLS